MDELRVESWSQLHEELFAGAWNATLRRHRSSLAFRGRNDAREPLRTSLMRLGGDPRALEVQLLRNFRKYAARGAVPADSAWNWLALGQHHGLPTRFLDWTYSPYVALHFATSDVRQFDRDGVVWTLDYARAHELVPLELRRRLDEEGADVFTTEMLAEAAPALADLDRLGDEPFAAFVEPPSFDDRIVNQYALFSLLSDPALALDEWLAGRPALARRLVIPAVL